MRLAIRRVVVLVCTMSWLSCSGNSPAQPSSTNTTSAPACAVSLWACASKGYGALAFSPATHATGDSYNYSSQTAAENAAVQYCGHADCYAVAWFENSCGAIAVAPTGQVGWGTASSGDAAEALALANCEIAH